MIAYGTPEKMLKSTDAQKSSDKKPATAGFFFFIFFEKTLDKL